MRYLITGADGFLGWHLSARIRATRGVAPTRIGRADFNSDALISAVRANPVIFHLAGVNRADTDEEVEVGNVVLAERLADAIRCNGRPVHVIYANSVHVKSDNAYGRGKARASEVLQAATQAVGGRTTDVLLPNLFGEHGRPAYNSFVATFCHEVANDRTPEVTGDREIVLLHAQDAAIEMLTAADREIDGTLEPAGEPRRISELLAHVKRFKELYDRGEIPDLSDPFARDLFNTYRSYTFPKQFPMTPAVNSDSRGSLFETVRSHGGTGQAFVSTTVPGATRGEHYHLRKVERFFVIAGEAQVSLRKLYSSEISQFRISGERPAFIDMPTMWVHNIRNVGRTGLVTMFWADQLLDPNDPDQYAEDVVVEEVI